MRSQWCAQSAAPTMCIVARLIVLWIRPQHLSPEAAERWVVEQVKDLVTCEGVGHADLRRVQSASSRYESDWDWMLELDVALPLPDCVDGWLADLRLLGMRPAVLLAAESIALEDD
jgi:hypothetical protein